MGTKRTTTFLCLIVVLQCIILPTLSQVYFPTSCSNDPSFQNSFNSAVTSLHLFSYDNARSSFNQLSNLYPTCAIVKWGIAMTYWRPISDETLDIQSGLPYITTAMQILNNSYTPTSSPSSSLSTSLSTSATTSASFTPSASSSPSILSTSSPSISILASLSTTPSSSFSTILSTSLSESSSISNTLSTSISSSLVASMSESSSVSNTLSTSVALSLVASLSESSSVSTAPTSSEASSLSSSTVSSFSPSSSVSAVALSPSSSLSSGASPSESGSTSFSTSVLASFSPSSTVVIPSESSSISPASSTAASPSPVVQRRQTNTNNEPTTLEVALITCLYSFYSAPSSTPYTTRLNNYTNCLSSYLASFPIPAPPASSTTAGNVIEFQSFYYLSLMATANTLPATSNTTVRDSIHIFASSALLGLLQLSPNHPGLLQYSILALSCPNLLVPEASSPYAQSVEALIPQFKSVIPSTATYSLLVPSIPYTMLGYPFNSIRYAYSSIQSVPITNIPSDALNYYTFNLVSMGEVSLYQQIVSAIENTTTGISRYIGAKQRGQIRMRYYLWTENYAAAVINLKGQCANSDTQESFDSMIERFFICYTLSISGVRTSDLSLATDSSQKTVFIISQIQTLYPTSISDAEFAQMIFMSNITSVWVESLSAPGNQIYPMFVSIVNAESNMSDALPQPRWQYARMHLAQWAYITEQFNIAYGQYNQMAIEDPGNFYAYYYGGNSAERWSDELTGDPHRLYADLMYLKLVAVCPSSYTAGLSVDEVGGSLIPLLGSFGVDLGPNGNRTASNCGKSEQVAQALRFLEDYQKTGVRGTPIVTIWVALIMSAIVGLLAAAIGYCWAPYQGLTYTRTP
eukprot:TRINITY_DN4960_c0_g1_i1.p1 TRINITY_DN4960_c0_g1~~TRINITY_DN4960_c0_g1_i1.p1  ORF type:complete len:861 (+),score=171.55 TRINITY_DN4960_c0_g1_i1:19-2601(+)